MGKRHWKLLADFSILKELWMWLSTGPLPLDYNFSFIISDRWLWFPFCHVKGDTNEIFRSGIDLICIGEFINWIFISFIYHLCGDSKEVFFSNLSSQQHRQILLLTQSDPVNFHARVGILNLGIPDKSPTNHYHSSQCTTLVLIWNILCIFIHSPPSLI